MNTMLLLNGPNLGILGRREPKIYGTDTLADIGQAVANEVSQKGWKVLSLQRESEGELVSAIHEHGPDSVGAAVNPGALMIAGWSLRDALASYEHPWIEVHLSNVWARGAVPARIGHRPARLGRRGRPRRVRLPPGGPRSAACDRRGPMTKAREEGMAYERDR